MHMIGKKGDFPQRQTLLDLQFQPAFRDGGAFLGSEQTAPPCRGPHQVKLHMSEGMFRVPPRLGMFVWLIGCCENRRLLSFIVAVMFTLSVEIRLDFWRLCGARS